LVEDSRIVKLRSLIAEAIEMRDSAEVLISELNDQLHLLVSAADDRGVPAERRRKPRSVPSVSPASSNSGE
jgi:hypothetical protein